MEELLRRLLAEKAAGRTGAGGTLREAIVGGALFGVHYSRRATLQPHPNPLEALYELLRHKYDRERACGALRLAVQLGGARFGKEQRLSSSHIVDLAGAELLVAAPQPRQLTSQFSVSHRQRPQSTTRCKETRKKHHAELLICHLSPQAQDVNRPHVKP